LADKKEERTVLLWTNDLKRLGFRHRTDRYWRCDRGYGLDASTHVSLFLWTTHAQLTARTACYEVAEFHVTFEVPGHNLHFYYHEARASEWVAAGHTSTAEVSRLGFDVTELRRIADAIAQRLVASLEGVLHDRDAD